jgi:hypothetical protein
VAAARVVRFGSQERSQNDRDTRKVEALTSHLRAPQAQHAKAPQGAASSASQPEKILGLAVNKMADFLGKSGRRKPVSRAAGRLTFRLSRFGGNSRAYTCEPTAQTRVAWNTGRDWNAPVLTVWQVLPATARAGRTTAYDAPTRRYTPRTRRTQDTVQANPRESTGTAVHDLEVHAPTTERPSAGRSGTARHTMTGTGHTPRSRSNTERKRHLQNDVLVLALLSRPCSFREARATSLCDTQQQPFVAQARGQKGCCSSGRARRLSR